MNFKPLVTLFLLVLLSACGHLDSDRATSSSDTEATSNPPPHTDDEQGDETDKIVLSDAELEAADAAPSADESAHGDLFARMRAGFTLPELDSKYVREYERWDATHPTYLKNLFVRATPFLYHIVEEIEKRGLPMELALLPAVESAYKPEAVSRSRAGGLWQFVPATGREFGLHDTWWYDGRRDAIASTNAALDYLEQLNKMFEGDWFLTLAAYNAGPGTVRRAIKRHRPQHKAVYKNLNLRSETQRYVPKLLALRNIVQNPKKFQVTLPKIASKPYFEVLELPGQIDLNHFAEQTQIDRDLLRHLNAGFKRWATAPDGPHRILVPIGNGDMITRAEAAIASAPAIRFQNHRVRRGDTLSGIARQYGVSVASLRKANHLQNNMIRADRNLVVPVRGGELAALDMASAQTEVVHHVQRGDTLWSIARRYNVQLRELLDWNNFARNQILQLNQTVLIRPSLN